MYDAVHDLYCYEGTTVLKNIPDIRDQASLNEFEAAMTMQRSDEPLPAGRLSVAHYCAIHRHLFQDVYPWAGEFRTVRMSKGGSAFCYPEYIEQEMQKLFDNLKDQNHLRELSADEFATGATHFLATLNAIHPFREGNGRAQTSFLLLLADRATHPLNLDKLVPGRFMEAMIASFEKDEEQLAVELKRLVSR
ncbi:MAG: Fic family protein [bacterium]|nr:Fic family protein [bacterium]